VLQTDTERVKWLLACNVVVIKCDPRSHPLHNFFEVSSILLCMDRKLAVGALTGLKNC
jgi:hypothetical protein